MSKTGKGECSCRISGRNYWDTKCKKSLQNIKIKGTEGFKRIDTPEISGLDYIIGLDKIKNALKGAIIDPVINEDIKAGLEKNKTNIPNGLLLVSPPGNGKTTLVKAIGAEAMMPVFEVRQTNELEGLTDPIAKDYEKTHQRAIVYMWHW